MKRKKLALYILFSMGIILVLGLAACRDPLADDGEVPAPSPTAVHDVLPTLASPVQSITVPTRVLPTNVPTPTAIIIPTAAPPTDMPGQTVNPTAPLKFNGLRFATAPDQAPKATFPAGTEEIFAIWEYVDLSPSDNIRRIWFRDDQIWLVREELWDSGRYGSSGTVWDISIYDNEGSGLPPANYRLQLYINDTLQQEASFAVEAP